jgi:uncharacterized C2H2 Zn-finger protein
MKRDLIRFRALATEIAALQAKARALGLFANDRELLECPVCGLMENVACGGRLFTCRPESLDDDTGLRFVALAGNHFQCPSCGATVSDTDSNHSGTNEAKGAKRSRCARTKRPTKYKNA